VVCPPDASCALHAGSPLAVTLGAQTQADFALDLLGRVRGRLVDAETGAPAVGGYAQLYATGSPVVAIVAAAPVDAAGKFEIPGLYPGTYKLGSYDTFSYIDRIYGGAACEGGSCDPDTGTPLAVQLGQTTQAADLRLDFGPGIAGWVRREGSAAGGVGIDVWTAAGQLYASVASAPNGRFRMAIPVAAPFYVTTDVGPLFIDEVYAGVACPNGPAYLGLCDPLEGQPLTPLLGQPAVDGVSFDLESRTALFRDGFESGGFGAWSQVLGIP
jgi:hypothetical protein